MIVIDSSAIVAIALGEPESSNFFNRLRLDAKSYLSTANYVEASLVLEGRYGPAGRLMFERTMTRLVASGLQLVDVDQRTADRARNAFRDYGKGRHPAGLNFGDCFAYALAKEMDVPLLYKGSDFDKTDVVPA